MDDLRKELIVQNMPGDDEHCVIHAMFPKQLETYYKKKEKTATKVSIPDMPKSSSSESSADKNVLRRYALRINGKRVEVDVEDLSFK